jgi:hypothetical protein
MADLLKFSLTEVKWWMTLVRAGFSRAVYAL